MLKSKNRLPALYIAILAAAYGSSALAEALALEEIIVTARKKLETIQDIGIAITALDSDAMARAGIQDISRIELISPGVSYGYIGSDAKLAIRGANSNNTFADNSSIAGFFVDGVYRPRASQQTQAFFDVERLEILKGPQGTLYGRNTFAGAVNVSTREPHMASQEGQLQLTASRFKSLRTEGFFNFPLTESLAVRLAFNSKDSDGWIDNRGEGDDLGQDEARNLRLSALWIPRDSLEFVARFSSLQERGITAGIFAAEGTCQPINERGITDAYGTLRQCSNPYPGADSNSYFDHPYTVSLDTNAERDNREDNVTLHAAWELNESLLLRSISSYTDFDSGFDWDGDWSNQPGYTYFWDEEVRSITQELQLAYDDETFSVTAGLYYSEDDIGFGFSQFRSEPFAQSSYADWQDIETTTEGLFLQLNYPLSESLSIVAGLRENREKKETNTYDASIFDDSGALLPGVENSALSGRARDIYRYTIDPTRSALRKFDITTWKLALEWQPHIHILGYASIATGFLSGGVNADGSAFEQQESKSYEIGLKSRWRDDSVQFNMAFYRNEFTNLTTQQLIQLGTGDVTITVNGGEVTATGLEMALMWMPAIGWTVTANSALMDNEFGRFGVSNPFEEVDGTPSKFIDLYGETPPWSPKMTVGVTLSYAYDWGEYGSVNPHLQFYYSDSYNTDDVVTYATQKQVSYTKTDIRLQWTAADERTRAEIFIENMEDEAVLARTNVGSFDLVQTSYLYPRNYGLKLSYKF